MNRWFVLAGVLIMGFGLAGCRTEPAPDPESESPPDTQAADTPAADTPAAEKPAENPPAAKADPAPKANPGPKANLAPEIQVAYWLNSDPLTLAALRGKIVVLEFWATWCPPCLTTIPHLARMYDAYKDKGVVFISLTNEPSQKVEPFVKRMKMPYPVGGGSPTGRVYRVRGIPHAFIIAPSGEVVWEGHPMGGLQEAIRKQLEETPPTK